MPLTDGLAVLEQSPALLYGATLLLGLIVGSFLNVVILRLPRIMEQQWRNECAELTAGDAATSRAEDGEPLGLAQPPSHCPACGGRIAPWDNIPILSWLLLRGRCRACQTPISMRYPLIEALTGLLSIVVIWHFGATSQALAALVLTWGLIALAVIDLETQLLPDDITLPLLWLGLLVSLGDLFTGINSAVLGAAGGYLLLWLTFHAFRLLTGKEGMGRGDFKLLAMLGAWMGWQSLAQIVLLSAVPGAIVGIALIAAGRHASGQPIPYGPFLATSGWINLIWGDAISAAYLQWAGLA